MSQSNKRFFIQIEKMCTCCYMHSMLKVLIRLFNYLHVFNWVCTEVNRSQLPVLSSRMKWCTINVLLVFAVHINHRNSFLCNIFVQWPQLQLRTLERKPLFYFCMISEGSNYNGICLFCIWTYFALFFFHSILGCKKQRLANYVTYWLYKNSVNNKCTVPANAHVCSTQCSIYVFGYHVFVCIRSV